MEKKEIYNILNTLGMVENKELSLELLEDICKDLPALMNFVDNLCLDNDLDTIQKFLVCLFYTKKSS